MTTDRTLAGVSAVLGRLTAMARAAPLATAVLMIAAGSSQPSAANARRPACCRTTDARPLAADARRRRRSDSRLPLEAPARERRAG